MFIFVLNLTPQNLGMKHPVLVANFGVITKRVVFRYTIRRKFIQIFELSVSPQVGFTLAQN